ncbi:MAG TPA: hypothetical protein VFW33_08765 [Gemmataceae bacterium]|nr:hypothetical protein [Gemmataceae bacterium]
MAEPDDEVDIREAYPLMDSVARAEGWDDPAMESYNAYARPGSKAGEISYDLVMGDDMDFVEGTYRLSGGEWRVFICSKRDTEEVNWKMSEWESGVTGVVFFLPRAFRLNKQTVLALISQALGVETWSDVRGPDSMTLR